MVIRTNQIQPFEHAGERSFHDRMVVHLQTHFPVHSQALGEPGVREVVAYGIERSRQYQIATERDVCKYISLMFAFGRDFDRDPKLPWAADILQNRVYQNGTDRVEVLYGTAKRRTYEAARQPQN